MKTESGVRCTEIAERTGERCRVTTTINPDTGLCFAHDPERREAHVRAASLGGKATRRARRLRDGRPPTDRPPRTLEEIAEWSAWVAFAVAAGHLEQASAREATKALKEARAALEPVEAMRELERIRRAAEGA